MQEGSKLVHRLPGRVGWELRLVMQGGWRIGSKTRALGGRIATQRPRIGKADAPALLWASLRHRLT